MEKREVRINCSGCGAGYKLRIPVTDKPVSFKCKKCGKIMKLKVRPPKPSPGERPAPEPPPPQPAAPEPSTPSVTDYSDPIPQFETTQLPDNEPLVPTTQSPESNIVGTGVAQPPSTPSGVETYELSQSQDQEVETPPTGRRWVVLAKNEVKGPYTDQEIAHMIRAGDVGPETSIRMGERPWIKAVQVGAFRGLFQSDSKVASSPALDSIEMPQSFELDDNAAPEASTGPAFYQNIKGLLPYPLGQGHVGPFAVFTAIAFVLSTVLCFWFEVGLVIHVVGWLVLYGYLGTLLDTSIKFPENPPPPWNITRIMEMTSRGAVILLMLFLYTLLPVGILLMLMIAAFLNSAPLMGNVFMALTVIGFAISMYIVPAGLAILGSSGDSRRALNPRNLLRMATQGGKSYKALALISLAAGLACMLATIANVFLTDIHTFGFLVAGLVSAVVYAYAHFIWFHAVGRFSGEHLATANRARATGRA